MQGSARHPAQTARAPGRTGDPRHSPAFLHPRRDRLGDRRALGKLVGDPALLRVCHVLRYEFGQPLARMRPWYRVQDRLDEPRALRDRLVHGHARGGRLALEPHPPPQRHHHRRARSGNPSAAPAGHVSPCAQPRQRRWLPELFSETAAARHRQDFRAGKNLHPPERVSEGLSECADLSGPLSGDHRVGCRDAELAAGLPVRPAAVFRDLADDHPEHAAARGPCGERARPPPQLPHGVYESNQPVHLLEHELSCGTPHVSAGPLSRLVRTARGDQGRLPAALPVDSISLAGDPADAHPAVE